jgi:hypothetical protein
MRERNANPFLGHKPGCWQDFLVLCPRRFRAVLPSSTRPNLFAGD